MNSDSQSRWQAFGATMVCYGAWPGLPGLGLWVTLQLLATTPTITLRLGLDAYTASLWNKASTVVILLLWLVLVMALEPYLRTGMEKHMLQSRILRAAIVGAVLLGVAEGIQLFL
jgi:hypothetical protein